MSIPLPAFLWCDADFTLPPIGPEWHAAWRLASEADVDALLYLNGDFVGRHAGATPHGIVIAFGRTGECSATSGVDGSDHKGAWRRLENQNFSDLAASWGCAAGAARIVHLCARGWLCAVDHRARNVCKHERQQGGMT